MRGNGKVFISHLDEDNVLCKPILDAFQEWGVDYWFDTERLRPGQALSDRIQSAIADRDIFIRVCTSSVLRHRYWVDEETNAFRALQADDEHAGRHGKRTLLSIVMDTYYVPQPFEKAHVYIDAARQTREAWLLALRRVLLPDSMGSSSVVNVNNPIVVDWQNTGDFTRISRAIDAAEDNQVIVIKPGTYRDNLSIYKNLEIRGEGRRSEIVIVAEGSDVVVCETATCKLSNLTLVQAGGKGTWYAIDAARGNAEIIDCDITSKSLACVGIHGKSKALISHCKVHSSAQSGLYFYDEGTGLVDNCEISNNDLHGIAVHGRSQPTVRSCHITNNKRDGIHVADSATGLYEVNQIFANQRSGIAVTDVGRPIVRSNTVHDNGMNGLRVYGLGGGVFEDNDFRQNRGGSKAVAAESRPFVTLTNNRE